MSTLEAAFGQLPEPILNKLDSMIRRVRRLLFLRGLFATLAVALACLLTIMLIDASVTLFSSASRWALSLVGLAITAAAAWKFLVRPLSKKFTLTHMARILEIRHPELQERISTAVELLSSDDPDSIKGSEELISAVVDSAVDDVQAVDPNTEFNPTKTRKFRNVSIAFAVVLLLSLVIWPKQSWTLLARAFAPFLDIGNAYADSLVVDPGDIRIAQGEPVSIEVSVKHKRLRRAEIRRIMPDGTESVERMTLIGEDADGTKRFSTTFPSVELGFDYRIRAGSALTRYYDVEAVAPPMVENLKIAYDYPDYTGLESREIDSETGEIRAVANTRVTVEANVNKPVQTSQLLINESTDLGVPEVEGNLLRWYFELKPNMKGNWQLDLTDLDGFRNPATTYPLEALPDKAPTVQLTQPVLREMKLKPTERLQLHAEVTEDFGVQDVALLVIPQGSTQPIEIKQPAATPANGPNQYHGAGLLDLAALSLKPEQRKISVQMQVRDNRPTDYDGPGIGLSEMIYIEIDRSAKSLADQAIEAQKKEVKEALKEAKQELEKARDDIRRTEDALKRDDEVSREARERLEEFSEHTEKARDELDKVANALDESLLAEQAEKADEIANETIAEAREKADLVPVLDEKSERIEEARAAREKIEDAIKQVDEIAKEMDKAEDDYEMISELNDLSNKQQELAMNAEQMAKEAQAKTESQEPDIQQDSSQQTELSPEEKRKLAEFQQKQEQLQKELGEMLKENAAALSEVLEEQKADAQAMAEQAAELAEQQNELREMSKEAIEADANQEEVLREQLLAFLEKEQSELANDAAAEAQAAQQEAQQSEQSTESAAEPSNSAESPSTEQPNTESSETSPSESDPSGAEPTGAEPEAGEASGQEESSTEPQMASTESSESQTEAGSEAAEMAQSDPAASESSPTEDSPSENGESQSAPTPEQALADQLAEAAEQASEAAQSLGEENLEAASEAASEASESLAEAASQSESGEMSEAGEAASESAASEEGSAEASSPEMAQNGEASDPASPASAESGSEEAGSQESGSEAAGEPSNSEMAESPASGTTPQELAERQQALAEQIEAVKNGDLQEALAQIEAQLSEEASELQAAADALEENMENLSQNSAKSGADRAEQALSRGSQKASDAANQLAQAQQQQSQAEAQSQVPEGELSQGAEQSMSRGLVEQEKTANYLEQATEALQATSEAIGQTQEGLEPSDMDQRIADSSDLANGFDEMSESAQSQSAQEAAQQSQEAAEAMQQLAQAAMEKLGMPGTPSQDSPPGPPMPPQQMTGDPTSESLNETGLKAADANGSGIPPELEQLGISVEDWAKFRGALVGGSATAIETELPAEYRELVGRYFQVIAKEAGKKK